MDADGDGKSHNQTAANAWAVQFFRHHLEDHQNVTNGCDQSCCTALCTATETACEIACALEIFGEPECGIACGVAGNACDAACSLSVEAPSRSTTEGEHRLAKVMDADGDGKSHNQTAANAWAVQFFRHHVEDHQNVTNGCDQSCCTALCTA